MIRAIIIDDVPDAVGMLSNDLAIHFPSIEVVGTAHSVVGGAKLLGQLRCDVLFLDIMLGDGTGFDLLEIHPNLKAKIIFVTSSDEHSLRAFQFAAIDYLLKPYTIDDLKRSIGRLQSYYPVEPEQMALLKERIKFPESRPNKISLHTLEEIRIINIQDIVRCESDDNNTWFYLADGSRIYVTKTLKHFDNILYPSGFARVHQSHLVNKTHIAAYIKSEGGYLKMDNGDDVPVSVRKKAGVMKMLSMK